MRNKETEINVPRDSKTEKEAETGTRDNAIQRQNQGAENTMKSFHGQELGNRFTDTTKGTTTAVRIFDGACV